MRVAGLDRRLGPAEAVAVLPVAGLIVWAPPLAVGFLLGLPFAVVLAAVLLLAAVGMAACEPFDFVGRRPRRGGGADAGGAGRRRGRLVLPGGDRGG